MKYFGFRMSESGRQSSFRDDRIPILSSFGQNRNSDLPVIRDDGVPTLSISFGQSRNSDLPEYLTCFMPFFVLLVAVYKNFAIFVFLSTEDLR
jgi:hypothetical protein